MFSKLTKFYRQAINAEPPEPKFRDEAQTWLIELEDLIAHALHNLPVMSDAEIREAQDTIKAYAMGETNLASLFDPDSTSKPSERRENLSWYSQDEEG